MRKLMSYRSLHHTLILATIVVSIHGFIVPKTRSANDIPNYIFPNETPAYGLVGGTTENVVVTATGVEGEFVIKNFTKIWLSLTTKADEGASVTADDVFSAFNVLPPDSSARFKGSMIRVNKNILISAKYNIEALSWNIADTILNTIPGADALSPSVLGETIQSIRALTAVQGAVEELKSIQYEGWPSVPSHVLGAANNLRQLATDEQQAELLLNILKHAKLNISSAFIKDAFTSLSIYNELDHIASLIVFTFTTDTASVLFEASSSTPRTGDIGGRILSGDGVLAIPEATVTLSNGRTTISTKTDGNGDYVFYRFPSGNAKISAEKAGIGSGSVQVQVTDQASTQAPLIKLINLTVALVIDSSGSMAYNDPNGLRKAAAKILIQALEPNDLITVIDFDTYARSIWNISPVSDKKDAIGQAIDTFIDNAGGTNISDGLRVAYGQISSAVYRRKVITVLLTDGQQDPPSSYDARWETAYKNDGLPIYTFGLSDQSDSVILQRIASTTGGQFTKLTDPSQLMGLYNRLRVEVSGSQLQLDNRFLLEQGQTQQVTANIPAYTQVATFVTTWPGSQVDTTLVQPGGAEINSATTNKYVIHTKDQTFEIYRIEYPVAGVWLARAYGTELTVGGEQVTLQADAFVGRQQHYLPLISKLPNTIASAPSSTPSQVTTAVPSITPLASPVPNQTNTATSTVTSTPTSTATTTSTAFPTDTPTNTPTYTPIPTHDLTLSISGNEQDGYEDPIFRLSGDDNHNDYIGVNAEVMAGLVFTNIPIPHGAKITSAYITMRGYGFDTQATSRIHAFAQDSSPIFIGDGSNKPSTRPLTTHFADWTETRPFQWQWLSTPDLSGMMQEVIDRPGWASGNNFGFRISNPSGAGANWSFVDFAQGPYAGDNGTGNSTILHITYSY